jgi:hypothetical protein
MDLTARVRIGAALVAGGMMVFGGASGVRAGALLPIDVTATAECDGTVTAEYGWLLPANQTLDIDVTFTAGALVVSESAPQVPASPDPQPVTGSATASGFSPGDVVVVDVAGFALPAELQPVGVTTVEIPECPPPATDPPATDPPATEPPATDPPATEPPATDPPATEPPATEPPATTQPPEVPVPVSTLPATGEGSLPRGVVAATVLLLGIGLVVLATRRRPDDQGFGTSR